MMEKTKKRPPLWFEGEETKAAFPQEVLKSIRVNIVESDDELIIKAGLPGYEKKDIKLKVGERSMDIFAQKKREEVTAKESFYKHEIGYGSVRRVIPLPVLIQPETARAKFENGMLAITVKKAEVKKKIRRQ
jgi:HSP20 family protein